MMKEDYLWDKSGAADPEIERLENALRVFRYRADEPPALPAKVIPFERKTPRSYFRLALAFAACAAVVMISLGVWFQFSERKVEVTKGSTETVVPPIIKKADEIPEAKPRDAIINKIKVPQQSVKSGVVKIKKLAVTIGDPIPTSPFEDETARKVEPKKPTIKLTKEEKYAYDQLMLALSVTSSTFKKVKDKVDGVEEKSAVRTGGR